MKKAFFICLVAVISSFYLINGITSGKTFTVQQLNDLIKQTIPDNQLRIAASPELVIEFNHILQNSSDRDDIRNALKRMYDYQVLLTKDFQNKKIPDDLMALPIVESEYKQLKGDEGTQEPAGIWQMVPDTARLYGLTINGKRDDRLNVPLETLATMNYLNDLYAQFHDWRLVIIAYKLGAVQAAELIKKVGSDDPVVIANSSAIPRDLKAYLTKIDSIVIIIHNPSFINR